MSCVTILGDGQMGLVSAAVLGVPEGRTDSGSVPEVTLWGHDRVEADALEQARVSTRLPGLELPEGVRVTGDDAAAFTGADLIVMAVPTQFVRTVLGRLAAHVPPGVPIVSVSKGIEDGTGLRPTEVIAEAVGGERAIGVLAGPTIAPELARCLPATMVIACDDGEVASFVQRLFSASWLRIYTSDDPVGVEIAGATKNVIAIAAGILDGLQAGYNAKSALLARGLAEITRLGVALGARTETFFGLTGVGDLATTCFSPEGRNRSCGEALGRGEALEHYLERTSSVVEGVPTAKAVLELARHHGVDMPIVEAVNRVLYGGLDPIDAIALLMSREPKAERVG
ncbi:MAG: NAD(P)H-dependent glycerol-3-phosphate dehydrogenase [Planctomycetota bacterium]